MMKTNMPYKTIRDLPDSIKNPLPERAQEIFLAAYNNAWAQYKNSADRKDNATREETAFKVAWSAVKQKYEKKGDAWQKK